MNIIQNAPCSVYSKCQCNAPKCLMGCVGNFKKVQNHFFIYKLKLEVNRLHIFEGHD